jgi:hypothetical protein
MTKPRVFSEVLTAMLAHIPEDETELRFQIERILSSSYYDAPEEVWFKRTPLLLAATQERFPGITDPREFPDWFQRAGEALRGDAASDGEAKP